MIMQLQFVILIWSLFPFLIFGTQSVSFDMCSFQLDSQTQKLLKQLNTESFSFTEDSLKAMQENPPMVEKSILSQIKKIENIDIPGPIGPIHARFYFPHKEGIHPVFVFFHGGGWVLGTLDEYDVLCQEICRQASCIVISVDYRLAPQYPFPIPLYDCYAATKWVAENIQKMGGDPKRLAIGGDSAGGNLAAAVTLIAKDKNSPLIQRQVLIYPALNAQFNTLSYYLFANGYYLTRELMQLFWKMYLQSSNDSQNYYACPLLAPTLSHLPPALIQVADADPLRDEALGYAWRLHEDQVPVRLIRYPTIHGFISFNPELDVAHQGIKEIAQYLQEAFFSSK